LVASLPEPVGGRNHQRPGTAAVIKQRPP
jgi:hypothetical protein